MIITLDVHCHTTNLSDMTFYVVRRQSTNADAVVACNKPQYHWEVVSIMSILAEEKKQQVAAYTSRGNPCSDLFHPLPAAVPETSSRLQPSYHT